MRLFLSLFFTLFLYFSSASQYRFNANCQKAWMLLMDLKINEAKSLMKKELAINPTNYYALYMQQTCDAYALVINSTEEEYEDFFDNYEKKREIMDDKYEDSPYYLTCKAAMELQVGYFKIMDNSTFSGVRISYSGYSDIYDNLEKYPHNSTCLMYDGFFNSALSNLPPFIKSTVSIFGVSSDFDYGIKTLNEVYEKNKNIKGVNAESALFIIFAAKINKTPEMVYGFTRTLDKNIANTFIHQYFKANIEYRTGRNEQALKTLSTMQYNNSSYSLFLYNYLKGKVLLRKLDSRAGYYIQQYLKNLKKKEYYKEMTYNLALYYLINGNKAKYKELCEEVVDEGKEINERDREALYDASLNYDPDVNLVKARLLLEGGYLSRFVKVLNVYEKNPKQGLPYQLEYHFLKGKYAEKTNNKPGAIKQYKWVIDKGSDEDYYFACEASLRLGMIYENSKDYKNAEKYYDLSVDLYEDEYYEYIGAKADKALERVEKILD